MDSAHSKNTKRSELTKSFSPLQVWALALGCIIGWGCFILPGIRFLPESGPVAACIGFTIGAILLIFVALSYGKMVENYPVAGGAFVYAYAGFGPTAAFICGWALVLGYLCIIALNGTALALLSRFMLPGVFEFGHLYDIAGWNVYAGELMFISAVILFFGIVNYRGGVVAGGAQLFMAMALVIGALIFAGSTLITPTTAISNMTPMFAENKSWIASIVAIVAIAPWLYVGFDTIPQAAEEFDFPHEKSTSLMVVAILGGAALYGIVTLATAIVIPYPELLATKPVWAMGTVAEIAMGRAGSIILALAVIAGICTGINGFYIATSRLIFGMARAHFLPRWFSKVHPTYNTPSNAILFTIVLSLIAPWFGREALSWVVDMSSVGTILAYGFTSFTAYKFMTGHPGLPGSGKGRVYAVIGSLASILCLGLLTIPGSPAAIQTESWYALLVWVGLGTVFYFAKAREVHNMSTDALSFLILGSNDKPVFFRANSVVD